MATGRLTSSRVRIEMMHATSCWNTVLKPRSASVEHRRVSVLGDGRADPPQDDVDVEPSLHRRSAGTRHPALDTRVGTPLGAHERYQTRAPSVMRLES